MKINTIPLSVINSMWLYCDNPRHSVFSSVDGFVWWALSYLLSDFTITDHLIFLCHPNSFHLQTLLSRLFLFKYCCNLPVHAHKDKLKLCNVFVLRRPSGFVMFCYSCTRDLPLNWAVFGLLKVGSVSLRGTRILGRPSRISFCSFCTNRYLGGAHNYCSQKCQTIMSRRGVTKSYMCALKSASLYWAETEPTGSLGAPYVYV